MRRFRIGANVGEKQKNKSDRTLSGALCLIFAVLNKTAMLSLRQLQIKWITIWDFSSRALLFPRALA